MSDNLLHNIITLPEGKNATAAVGERHDIVFLFDATKANPNGDPDAGNTPRLQPDSLKGLVTDVCLKRKVRNFFSLYEPDGNLQNGQAAAGYGIFIRENAVLQDLLEKDDLAKKAEEIFNGYVETNKGKWEKPAKGKQGKTEFIQRAYRDAACQTYYDLRAFGGVISTEGPLKGSFFGQVRGPLQFTFAESLDRILQLDATITRCAVASEKEKKQTESDDAEAGGNRTMGRKHLVDYGLYRAHIFFSPAFAAKTGFTYRDLDNFFFALNHLFRDDAAAGRAGMRVVGLVDFQHASALGNEHAHKLFEKVAVEKRDKRKEFPSSLADYHGNAPAGAVVIAKENDQEKTLVMAHQIVWEVAAQ